MSFPSQQRVNVPDHVLFRELDGEAVLLNLDSETYFGLDETGTAIWQQLTAQPTVQAAYESLLADYTVSAAVLQTDLSRLVRELVEHGLLELAGG